MDANVLFSKALGLGSGWKVVKSEMDVGGRELKLWLDFEPGSQFACPQCGEFCAVHDTERLMTSAVRKFRSCRLMSGKLFWRATRRGSAIDGCRRTLTRGPRPTYSV